MASSTETTFLQLEAVSPAPPPSYITGSNITGSNTLPGSGEILNLEVMSPAAMAYLLEVLSVDINKVEEFNRLRRNSGGKVGFVLGGKGSDEVPVIHATQKPVPMASKLVTTQSTVVTLPSVATILTTSAPTLVDVTNHEQLSSDEHIINKTLTSPLKRTSQRKRTLDEDEDDGVVVVASQSSKKRSRSVTTSSEENHSPSPQKQRSSSTRSVGSPKSISSVSDTSTTVVEPTLKTTDNNNTPDDKDAKKSRSRRFKEDELAFLDAVFKTEPYPDPMITERLSIQLDVPEHRIKVWFANRRHRQSRSSDSKPTTPTMEKNDLLTETAALPAESSHASSAFPHSQSLTPPYGMVPSGYEYPHPPPKTTAPPPLRTIPPRTSDIEGSVPSGYDYLRPQPKTHAPPLRTIPSRTPDLEAQRRHAGYDYLHPPPKTHAPPLRTIPLRTPNLEGMVSSGYDYPHPPPKTHAPPLRTIPPRTPDIEAQLRHDAQIRHEAQVRSQIASTIQSRFPFSSPALLQLANQTMLSRSGLNPYHHPFSYPIPAGMPFGQIPPGPADVCDLARAPKQLPANFSYYMEPPILPPLTADSTSYTDGISLSPAIDDSPSPWHWMP